MPRTRLAPLSQALASGSLNGDTWQDLDDYVIEVGWVRTRIGCSQTLVVPNNVFRLAGVALT